jgi:hypothetical protein
MRFSDEVIARLASRVQVVLPHLNERQRRLVLAQEARLLGHGGLVSGDLGAVGERVSAAKAAR